MTNLSGFYIKSITLNGQDITNKNVDLAQTGAGQLEVVLREGTGEVDATVQPPDTAAFVVLVLNPLEAMAMVCSSVMPDRGRSFTISNLRPGAYMAYAADRLTINSWQNPEFLRDVAKLGPPIEVARKAGSRFSCKSCPLTRCRTQPLGRG